MSIRLHPSATLRRLLGAALVIGAGAVHAAGGFSVTRSQESQITAGMSRDAVRQALGRPEQIIQYGNQPGPTWTYEVRDATDHYVLFDVDFGGDGKVRSASERIEERGGS